MEKRRNLSVQISPALNTPLKIAAINEGLKRYQWIEQAIIERLEKQGVKLPKLKQKQS